MIYFLGSFVLFGVLVAFMIKDDYEVETCEKRGYKNH